MKKTTFLIICYLLSFSVSQQALAQTVYVDGSFIGTSDGTVSAPYKTIGDALTARDLAGITGMTSDEEIIVSGGTYTPSTVSESGYITSTNGGYGNYWLTLKAADGETVILDGANLYDDKFAALITITSGATNVKVDGFILKNQRNNPTLTTTVNGVTIKDVKFGIQVGNYVTNVEITNNEIYDFSWTSSVDPMTNRTSFTSADIAILSAAVGGDNIGAISVVGTSLTSVTGLVISNNYIHNIIPGWTEAIQVNGNVNGFEISNNTINEVQNIGIVAAGHYAWVEAIDGATVTTALNQARNGVISGNKVTSCRSPIAAAAGIYCDGSANVTVENNEASDGQVGFSIGNENTSSNSGGHIVRNNVSYDNAWAGFLFGVPDAAGNSYINSVTVTGNTSFRNGGVTDTYLGYMGQAEVIINKNINNLSIENNIFYSPNHANLISISAAFTTGYEAYYNTMSFDYNTYYSDITTSGATGIFDLSQAGLGWYGTFAYYKASNTLSLDQNSQFADPLFTNTTSGSVDLSLQSTSPAINAGNPSYSVSTGETDVLGNDRIASSIIDAGAYEYGSTSSSSPVNLALNGTATQSSTAYGGDASRAIDGDTNGVFSGGSVTHTNNETGAWWQVDLGADQSIGDINIYNRTGCCSNRLTNFTVYVINSSGTTTYSESFTSYPDPSISLNVGNVFGQIIKVQLDDTNPLSLAEVQVYEGTAAVNLALSGTATQSSTAFGGDASRAIDEDTNGDYNSGNSVTHTNSEANAWWQVDLGADKSIGEINVYNRTDCCSNRLTNFTVYVINSSGTTTYSQSFTSSPDPSISLNAGAVLGQIIKIQLDDTNVLSLAEVEIYEGTVADNLAASGTATQSSTAHSGVASRAIDGDTNGDWSGASVTHTNSEANAWWQVDLGTDKNIGVINVFNRINCCSDRLTNFTVYVINSSGITTYSESFTSYPDPSIAINTGDVLGQKIKIQLDDTNVLSLAEVEVYSYVASTSVSGSTSKAKTEKTLSFNDSSSNPSAFSIYPNPSAEIINLKGVTESDTIEIYNIMGNLVLKARDTQINISDLPKGIYFAKTLNQDAVKFIKK